MKLWLVAISVCLAVATAHAQSSRNPDRAPDYASETYWQKNSIYVLRILDITSLETQQISEWVINSQGERVLKRGTVPNPYKAQYDLETIRIFTPDEIANRHLVQTSNLWFGVSMGSIRPDPPLSKGDLILVSEEKSLPKDRRRLVCKKLDAPMQTLPLIKSLEKISKIRASDDKAAALAKGIQDADPLVVRYCVNTLTDKEARIADESLLKRLLEIRSDKGFPMALRIKAAELYEKSFDKPRAASEKIEWMQEVLRKPADTTGYEIALVAQALIANGERQAVVRFLLGLVNDADTPEPARSVAASAVSAPPCYTPDNGNDLLSMQIFDTYLRLLKHHEAGMRLIAAQGISSICSALKNNPKNKPIIARAEIALEEAIKTETDENVARDLRRLHYPLDFLLEENE
jgi:hypothetical protein